MGYITSVLPLVTYQEYYHCLCPHEDPHLSQPTAQQWVSMCIILIWVHIDHLEVLVGIEMEQLMHQKDSYAISMRVLLQQCIDLF